jgi:hypothetical protein
VGLEILWFVLVQECFREKSMQGVAKKRKNILSWKDILPGIHVSWYEHAQNLVAEILLKRQLGALKLPPPSSPHGLYLVAKEVTVPHHPAR